MMAMWVSMCCCLHWVTGFHRTHPGTHWTCVPCQIPFKDCGLPESRLACWLPTSVLHQLLKLCCYEYLRILWIYLWKIRTDWLDELKLKLVVASNINPFTTSLFLRMSLSPSTNFPTPTQYQKDFAAWDLYQAPDSTFPCLWCLWLPRIFSNSTRWDLTTPKSSLKLQVYHVFPGEMKKYYWSTTLATIRHLFWWRLLLLFFFVCLRLSIKILQDGLGVSSG